MGADAQSKQTAQEDDEENEDNNKDNNENNYELANRTSDSIMSRGANASSDGDSFELERQASNLTENSDLSMKNKIESDLSGRVDREEESKDAKGSGMRN